MRGEIRDIIEVALSVFCCTGFWTWLTTRSHKKSAETRLLLGIAYAKIIAVCEKYIEQGWIPSGEYNELNRYLFEPYENSGGDGTAKKLMGEVRKLPIKKED